jgi:isopenicillin-N N-acyltransferase-like protein
MISKIIDPSVAITMEHPSVKTIYCTGTPYEIGLTHGTIAAQEIHTNVATYTFFFQETAKITWAEARERAAAQFVPTLQVKYPEILEEMRGIAEGAGKGLALEDILTLNVRSEIALTNYSDGCTCISQSNPLTSSVFLGQNWDWLEELHQGIVFLHIVPLSSPAHPTKPKEMKFLSEAGIVGKIGANSSGLGLCMNALRSGSLKKSNFPVHIMSRRLLEYATSFDSALGIIELFGLASTTNYMIADKSGKYADIECSPLGNVVIPPTDPSAQGRGVGPYVAHTNHLYASDRPKNLKDHPSQNSFDRLERMRELTEADARSGKVPTFDSIRARLSDQVGTPYSICRDRPKGAIGMERMTTLSTVIIELSTEEVKVKATIGRPCDDLPVVEWSL